MSNAWQDPDDVADDAFDGRPSKSERKREMHALQDIGAELVELPADRLKRLELPEDLRAAVLEARRITKHEARRRQMQYIGKLMRGVDAEPIRAALDAFKNVSKEEIARHHRLERLRDDFLGDEQVAGRIVEQWPHADLQHLRTLRRNALKEREQNKPPRAYREIFRILRELDGAPARDDEELDDTESA
ncbi:MAG: DUF615 domain-containing protein [Pseudazoarcus pumilus]|nr:DUF615 domain-containing protein [Pseudazoarcus pumilus]